MYIPPEAYEQECPIIEIYRGCNIYECAYECLFYSTKFPDGTHTGAETVEEVKKAIDAYYNI